MSVRVSGPPEPARAAIEALRLRLDLPDAFPEAVLAEAAEAATWRPEGYLDRTDVEFVTIDPESSMDLDQALHIARDGDGYLVRYAISDVAFFVRPGTELERETHRRGQTKYAPGARIPLHPPVLSEAAASLLADGVPRPALVWELGVDGDGELRGVGLVRALVRSRAKLSYAGVQRAFDDGDPHPSVALLPEVGKLRLRKETERGGASLNLPDQEIVEHDGAWELAFRQLTRVEEYNAQISLLAGFAAARTMIDGRTGILRTLPPAEEDAVRKLRRAAAALGIDWRSDVSYAEVLRTLSPDHPRDLAFLTRCTTLFRGAGYLAFAGELPEGNLLHGALAAPYAHTTAPLRRLVDRYALEICHALLNDLEIPAWVCEGLADLPEEMAATSRAANAYERGILDIAEALVLSGRVGETLDGVVTDVNPKNNLATVQIQDPAVELRVANGSRSAGERIRIRVDAVEVLAPRVDVSRA
ncbi:RNB domain-containing ribonuclease [Tessaracoccus sp.]|uniref:RNB domain-containing ribonuclease n=1 Tax=Tessaracoccus sp. TaxID=1971211 RepID=UPI0026107F06|nr:RNB domain-containing ribonuclease [Tessaracoccus sp.]